MRIIGLDLGSKSLGIAISDELNILASALTTYYFAEDDYDSAAKYLVDLANKENVIDIVLGLPKHMNNDLGIRAQISIDFKEKIQKLNPNLNVILVDERLTTSLVDKAMILNNVRRKERKAKKDELAAEIILQNYLDRRTK